MSDLDPKIKEDLTKKIENIGNDTVYLGKKSQEVQELKVDPIIFIATFALLILIGVFVYKKFNKETVSLPNVNPINQTYNQSPQVYRNNPQEYQNNNYNLNNNVYNNKLKDIDSRLDKLDHRTWLLAVANNENSVLSSQIAKRIGPSAEFYSQKYLTFDSNWKLNKSPEFLDLTEEDRYNLLNHVNNTYRPTIQPVQRQVQSTQRQVQPVQRQIQTFNQPAQVFNWNPCY